MARWAPRGRWSSRGPSTARWCWRWSRASCAACRSERAMNQPLHVMSLRNVIAFGGPDTTILGWFAHMDRARFRVSRATFDTPGRPDESFLARLREDGHDTWRIPWGERKSMVAA